MNKIVRTCAGGGGRALTGKSDVTGSRPASVWMALSAFTMAEILLSLTIIGVVAAITLPSLTGNINERTWNTQRKALFARMSQALPLMNALNGYGTFKAASGTEGTESYDAGSDNCAETFITEGLSKVLKINNICDSDHIQDCGISSKITTLKGNSLDFPKTMEELNDKMVGSGRTAHNGYSIYKNKAAAFETQNGESIAVYYNPLCMGSLNETPFNSEAVGNSAGNIYIQQRICANFIYDLNGNKGPNTVGKDIGFMTVMYPFDAQLFMPIPAPSPLSGEFHTNKVTSVCTDFNKDYRVPRGDELASMFVNKKLIDVASYEGTGYLSSEVFYHPDGKYNALWQDLDNGTRDDYGIGRIWCIKR